MRHIIALLALILLIVACENKTAIKDNPLIQHLPEDSKIILHTEDLDEVMEFARSLDIYNEIDGLSRIKEIQKSASFLTHYDLKNLSFITLSIEGKNDAVITLITENSTSRIDSTATREELIYDGKQFFKDAVDGASYFYTNYNGVHIASSSRLVLESLMRREINDYVFDEAFNDIFNRTQGADPAIYIKGSNDEWLKQFILGKNIDDRTRDGLWYELEPQLSKNQLKLDGIITYKDSIKMYQSLFNKVIPQKNKLVNIAPITTAALMSVTYKNADQLYANLNNYHTTQLKLPTLHKTILANTDEFAELTLGNNTALAFSLKPYETLFIDIDSLSVSDYTYRDKKIYELNQSLKTSSFKPLMHSRTYTHATQFSNYLIFAENQATLESIISNVQNNTVIGKQIWWEEARSSLSDNSTLLKLYNINTLKELSSITQPEDKKVLKKLNTDAHPLWISQYVHEDEYAHYHFIVPTASSDPTRSLTSQIASYRSDLPIISGPFLFPNHITKKHDIAFQDEDHVLHLISSKGELLWSKPLDSQINGGIHVVDGYKNGRKQLVFSTYDKVYYLDRKGRDVTAYPIQFKNGISQPVSVFDYDNTRNYRFLVTSQDQLTMLNIQGKKVTGFKYRPNGVITTQPQHYRSGTRDYICFGRDDQPIAVLNRTGKTRTSVAQVLKIKGDLYFNENSILLQTADNEKAVINLTTGLVEKESVGWANSSIFKMESDLEVVQSNNILEINGEELELPYGTYTAAQISMINGEPFVHLIEQGDHKVYILNQEARIIPGLPVYGKETAAIEQSDIRYLVTKDQRDIIIYKW